MTRLLPVLCLLLLLLPALADPAEDKWQMWTETANKLQKEGRLDEALIAFKQAAKLTDAFPYDDKRVMNSYQRLHACCLQMRQPEEADKAGALFIARLEKELGEKDPRVGDFLFAGGELHRNNMDPARGVFFYRLALTAREKELGPDAPALVDILTALGDLLYRHGRRAEAQPYFLRAVAVMEKAGGPGDPRLIPALSKLAESARSPDARQAAALYRRIRDIEDAALWPDDPRVNGTMYWQASLYKWQQVRLPEEIRLQQQMIAWFDRTALTGKDSAYELAHRALAEGYQQLGYYDEAQAEREWLAEHYARNNFPTLMKYNVTGLGDLAMAQGRYAEAEPHYRQGVALAEEEAAKPVKEEYRRDSRNEVLVDMLLDLSECLRAQGKAEDAQQTLDAAKDICLKMNYPPRGYTLLTGEVLRGPSDFATSLARDAEQTEKRESLRHYRTADAYRNLGRYFMTLKQPARAEAPLQKVVDAWEGMLGSNHRVLTYPLTELASCKAALGKTEEADKLFQRAVAIAETAYGKDAPILGAMRMIYARGKGQ